MANLILKTGDVFTTSARGIGHGVNIDGLMGHGIAVQFRNRFSAMHQEYVALCKRGGLLPGDTFIYQLPESPGRLPMFVYNIASQDRPGKNAKMEWLVSGVKKAVDHAASAGLSSIALPRIGSGIGGLDERQVEYQLSRIVINSRVDIEVWTLPQPPR